MTSPLRSTLCLGLVGVALLSAESARAADAHFAGDLDPTQEVTPPVGLDGHQPTGGAVFTYNDATKTLCGRIEYDDLTGPPTGIHVHQAPMGQPHADGPTTAKVIIPISASPVVFKVVLDKAWERSLVEGEIYANVHTATNSKGEIRATMDPCPDCEDVAVDCPDGEPLPLGVPPDDAGASDAGASVSDAGGVPAAPDTSNDTNDTTDGTDLAEPPPPAPKKDAGGCSTSTRTGASGGAVAAFVALVLVRMRRRRRD